MAEFGSVLGSKHIATPLRGEIGIYCVSDGGTPPHKVGFAGKMANVETGQVSMHGLGGRIASGRTWLPNLHVHGVAIVNPQSATGQLQNNAQKLEKQVHERIKFDGYAERIPFLESDFDSEWFRLTAAGEQKKAEVPGWNFPDYVFHDVVCRLFPNDVSEIQRWMSGTREPIRYVGCMQSREVLATGRIAGGTAMRTATGVNNAAQRAERIRMYNRNRVRQVDPNMEWREPTDLRANMTNMMRFLRRGKAGATPEILSLFNKDALFALLKRVETGNEFEIHTEALAYVKAYTDRDARAKQREEEEKKAEEEEAKRQEEQGGAQEQQEEDKQEEKMFALVRLSRASRFGFTVVQLLSGNRVRYYGTLDKDRRNGKWKPVWYVTGRGGGAQKEVYAASAPRKRGKQQYEPAISSAPRDKSFVGRMWRQPANSNVTSIPPSVMKEYD